MRRVLALIVLLLFIGTAGAQTTPKHRTPPPAPVPQDEGPEIAQRLKAVMDAWSTGDYEHAAPYFAKDANVVLFDLTSTEYKGWDAYIAGMEKFYASYDSIDFRLNDDAVVRQLGPLAYATATWDGLATLKDRNKQHFTVRWTAVLEKRGSEWLVVHLHASVPLGGVAAPAPTNKQ
jgi:uncharacterized protein (TIGR02246 family)